MSAIKLIQDLIGKNYILIDEDQKENIELDKDCIE